ncbi:MAG: alpha/beta hydrolase [Steroidobacteraceae bacterium]
MRVVAQGEQVQLAGVAGPLQAVIEVPVAAAAAPSAFMVVCHPHPLHGGTMDNKVVTTLARAAHELSVPSIRFNYRGVGTSAGIYDHGRGETDDALTAVAHGRQRWPDASVWLAGFSFGGVVALRASTRHGAATVGRLVTVAPALGHNYPAARDIEVPQCPWLVVQGDADDVVDPAVNIQWAAQLVPPPRLVVLPGVGHFFHGQLGALLEQVRPFLAA